MTNHILTPDNIDCEQCLLIYPQLHYKDLAHKFSTGFNMYLCILFFGFTNRLMTKNVVDIYLNIS